MYRFNPQSPLLTERPEVYSFSGQKNVETAFLPFFLLICGAHVGLPAEVSAPKFWKISKIIFFDTKHSKR